MGGDAGRDGRSRGRDPLMRRRRGPLGDGRRAGAFQDDRVYHKVPGACQGMARRVLEAARKEDARNQGKGHRTQDTGQRKSDRREISGKRLITGLSSFLFPLPFALFVLRLHEFPGRLLPFPLDRPLPLEPAADQPAERGPDQTDTPAGEHVGRVMDPHVDAAHAHQAGQEQRHRKDVELEPALGDQAGERAPRVR